MLCHTYQIHSFIHSFIHHRNFLKNDRAQQAAVLFIITLAVAIGFIDWMEHLYFVSGRLMYPAHVPISLAITGGLYLLVRRWPQWSFPVRTYTTGVMSVSGVLIPAIV